MFIPLFHKHSDVRIALVEPNVRVAVYTHTTLKAFLASLYLFVLVRLWNKQLFAYVNHARIRSWNQPVLSNESKVSCSRKTAGAFDGARTHDWQVSTDHESDAISTAPRRLLVELDSEHNFVAEKETFCLHYTPKCYIFRWNMDPCYASVMIVRSVYTNSRWYTVKHWSRLSIGCQLCTSKRSRSVMSSYMCSVQFTEQIKKAGRYSGVSWWVRNDYTICIVNVRSEKGSIDLFITFVYLFSVLCVFCVCAFCICFSVVFVLFG